MERRVICMQSQCSIPLPCILVLSNRNMYIYTRHQHFDRRGSCSGGNWRLETRTRIAFFASSPGLHARVYRSSTRTLRSHLFGIAKGVYSSMGCTCCSRC